MESVLTNISTLTPASKILQESMFPSSLTKLSLSAKWRPRQESQFISSHWCRPSNDCKVHDCHRRSCSSPFISGRHIWGINDQENALALFGPLVTERSDQISTDTKSMLPLLPPCLDVWDVLFKNLITVIWMFKGVTTKLDKSKIQPKPSSIGI